MQRRTKYMVLAADVVGSSRLAEAERARLQERLTEFISNLNRLHAQRLRTRVVIAAGDSLQAVVGDPSVVTDIAWDVWRSFEDLDIRLGVGYGPIFTPFSEDSRLMDGPAFHNATEFANREQGVVFRGFGDAEDTVLSGLGALLRALFQHFTPRQREALTLLRTGIPQSEIASRQGITKQAVSRLIKTAGWHGYGKGEAALREALGLFIAQDDSGSGP